jgi:hypothetical protein
MIQTGAGFHEFMTGWGWVLASVVAAVFSAGFFLVNQYMKQPGHLLVFWMRVIVVVAMSPLMLYVELPTDPRFYAAVILTVFAGTFADVRTFNAAAKFGGGVVSRVQPVTVWCAFLLWFFFDPGLLARYAAHPANTAIILAALLGCVYFASHMNKCEVTRAALIYTAPALAGYTVTTVLNKYAMDHGPLEGAVYGYMYIQSFTAVLVTGVYSLVKGIGPSTTVSWVNKKMLTAVLLAAAAWTCHMIFKNYAMAFTPNPSYQAAINLSTPLFILFFYALARHKEEARVLPGLGIVACAIVLALAAAR